MELFASSLMKVRLVGADSSAYRPNPILSLATFSSRSLFEQMWKVRQRPQGKAGPFCGFAAPGSKSHSAAPPPAMSSSNAVISDDPFNVSIIYSMKARTRSGTGLPPTIVAWINSKSPGLQSSSRGTSFLRQFRRRHDRGPAAQGRCRQVPFVSWSRDCSRSGFSSPAAQSRPLDGSVEFCAARQRNGSQGASEPGCKRPSHVDHGSASSESSCGSTRVCPRRLTKEPCAKLALA